MRSGFTQRASFLLAASLLVAALATAAVDGFVLKRTAKAGDTSKSKIKIDFDYQGSPVNVTIDATSKILEVKDDGSVVEETVQSNLSVMMAGTEVAHQDEAGTSKVTRDKRGLATEIGSAEEGGNNWRNERIVGLVYPEKAVSVGDKWTHESAADKNKELPAAKASYEVQGKESYKGKDVLKISFEFEESGVDDAITSTGTMWVSIASGEVLKAEGKIKNFPIPQTGPVDATWKQESA